MANIMRVSAALCLAAWALLIDAGMCMESVTEQADIIIDGIVKLDAPVRLKSSAVKLLLNGGDQVAFVRANGYFAIRVDPGTHFLHVSAVGATFPQVRLDVSAKHKGRYKATVLVEGKAVHVSTDELTISPVGHEVYFDRRQPFNIWSVLKSPMGIMCAVMLVGALLLPSLMEGIDPEEMKQMQEDMRKQPSITSLLSGGGGAGPLAPPVGGRR